MYLLDFGPETFLPFLVFSIPIIAIVGGITAGIVKTLSQQRMIEMAQRERIAAIERGIDPAKLPPLPMGFGDDLMGAGLSPNEYQRRRSQGLMIGGLVTTAGGVGLLTFLMLIEPGDNVWAVGLMPITIGAALLLSAWLVRPRNGGV